MYRFDEDNKVLILGATGNFGSKIAKELVKSKVPIIIAGREEKSLLFLKKQLLRSVNDINALVDIACFEVRKRLSQELLRLRPKLVINTCGPFQTADYTTAINTIILGINYIDLADARKYVNEFSILHEQAIKKRCLAITGASTLSCLTSAVLQHYRQEFKSIDSLLFGISLGQKTERGLASFQSLLSYLGRSFTPVPGINKKVYGWQDLYRQTYPGLKKRWMANCEVADFDLLTNYFAIESIRFSAGIENSAAHLGLWLLSWFIRLGFPLKLEKHAKTLLRLSHWFDHYGSNEDAMHMLISGKDEKANQKNIKWFIVAKNGDGPYIAVIPAVILAKQILREEIDKTGAITGINLIPLERYLAELKEKDIHVYSEVVKKH